MKPATFIAIVAIVIALGVGTFFAFSGDEKQNDNATNTPQPTTETTSQDSNESGSSADEEHLAQANFGERIDATGLSTVSLHIDDFIFKETIVTIDKGTTVSWVNDGQVRHDVTTADSSELKGIDSQLLATGETFEHTFDQPGTYRYLCSPHPTQMRGIIIVQ